MQPSSISMNFTKHSVSAAVPMLRRNEEFETGWDRHSVRPVYTRQVVLTITARVDQTDRRQWTTSKCYHMTYPTVSDSMVQSSIALLIFPSLKVDSIASCDPSLTTKTLLLSCRKYKSSFDEYCHHSFSCGKVITSSCGIKTSVRPIELWDGIITNKNDNILPCCVIISMLYV